MLANKPRSGRFELPAGFEMPSSFYSFVCRGLPFVIALCVFGGCKRKEVRVYTAPKEIPFDPNANAARQAPGASPESTRDVWRPELTYRLPAGWRELGPDAANVGRFAAGDVSIAVTALMSMRGNESGLVNMWRQVRGQTPLSEEEAAKTLHDVEIAGDTGKMFEVMDEEGGKPRRFIVAFVHRPEGSLFFKIQGEDAAVTAQKPAFFEFLKSVQFTGGSAPVPTPPANPSAAAAVSPGPAAAPAPPNLPAGWTAVAPGPMQVAKFTVPEKDGAKAEVAISVFPSDTGGLASNVKRWRGQLGMPEVDDAAAAASAKPIAGAPQGSVLVELENEGRGLMGAIIPRDGKWWFYKMMGDAPAVSAAREAFVTFAKAGQP
jgi:hypothetical protein